LPLRRGFEKTKARSSRFCSVFERSNSSAAREATEIKVSSVVPVVPLALLVLLNEQRDLGLPAVQLARLSIRHRKRGCLVRVDPGPDYARLAW